MMISGFFRFFPPSLPPILRSALPPLRGPPRRASRPADNQLLSTVSVCNNVLVLVHQVDPCGADRVDVVGFVVVFATLTDGDTVVDVVARRIALVVLALQRPPPRGVEAQLVSSAVLNVNAVGAGQVAQGRGGRTLTGSRAPPPPDGFEPAPQTGEEERRRGGAHQTVAEEARGGGRGAGPGAQGGVAKALPEGRGATQQHHLRWGRAAAAPAAAGRPQRSAASGARWRAGGSPCSPRPRAATASAVSALPPPPAARPRALGGGG